jgi:dipeptide/tripeptide permease
MAWDDHPHARRYLQIAIGAVLLIAGVTLSITESTESRTAVFYGLILIGIYNIGIGIYRLGVENAAVQGYEARQQRIERQQRRNEHLNE